jgi:hypothetical protein
MTQCLHLLLPFSGAPWRRMALVGKPLAACWSHSPWPGLIASVTGEDEQPIGRNHNPGRGGAVVESWPISGDTPGVAGGVRIVSAAIGRS